MFAFLTEEGFIQNLNDKLFIYLNPKKVFHTKRARRNEPLYGMRLFKRAHKLYRG